MSPGSNPGQGCTVLANYSSHAKTHHNGLVERSNWKKKGCKTRRYIARNYFRYETIKKVEEKFKKGDVLSGPTIVDEEGVMIEPDHVWCVYRKTKAPLNIMAMKRNKTNGKLMCGMSYHQYSQEKEADVCGCTRDQIEDAAGGYCVLVPYRATHRNKFECQYEAVFSDWDVIGSSGTKLTGTLPSGIFHECKELIT